jgi:hypothetical protein
MRLKVPLAMTIRLGATVGCLAAYSGSPAIALLSFAYERLKNC